ncbi:MAG TPA: DUF805 domain-containing protein [Salinisphaeraceae bacterium]|nr:DUF805 domain-containing protein [Salinisphaeraceae bacterium]
MDFRYLYTSFDGRINRKPFWYASIVLIVAAFIVALVVVTPLTVASPTLGALAGLILYLALLYPAIALGVKRLHDHDKSGWLMAVFVAPGLLSQLGSLLGITGSEKIIAGESIFMPNALGWLLTLLALIVAIWALVTLGIRKGTPGPNNHGDDPLAGAPESASVHAD